MHSCEEHLVRQFDCHDWTQDRYVCSICGKTFEPKKIAAHVEYVEVVPVG